jgi:hypothetical protein
MHTERLEPDLEARQHGGYEKLSPLGHWCFGGARRDSGHRPHDARRQPRRLYRGQEQLGEQYVTSNRNSAGHHHWFRH